MRESAACPLESVLQTIRAKYALTKSCQSGKAYNIAFKAYKDWLKTNHPIEFQYFSPCSGPTIAECFPWVAFNLASAFLLYLANSDKKGLPVVTQTLSALNFMLMQQHVLAEHVLGNLCPVVQKLRHSFGVSGGAMAASGETTKQYRNAKLFARGLDGTFTKQKDPQMGKVYKCLSHSKLVQVQEWYLLGKCAPTVPALTARNLSAQAMKQDRLLRARDRLLFNTSHFATMRGDDLRSSAVTWGHVNVLPMPLSIGPDYSYIYMILKDTSKNNQKGRTEIAGWLRHKYPELCCTNAIGEYLILLYGRGNRKPFPDIFNPEDDWTNKNNYLMVGSCQNYNRPMFYSKKSKKVIMNDKEDEDELGQYEGFRILKQAVVIRT